MGVLGAGEKSVFDCVGAGDLLEISALGETHCVSRLDYNFHIMR